MKVSNLEKKEALNPRLKKLAELAPQGLIRYNPVSQKLTTRLMWDEDKIDDLSAKLERQDYEMRGDAPALRNEYQEIYPFINNELEIKTLDEEGIFREEEVYKVLDRIKKPIEKYVHEKIRPRKDFCLEGLLISSLLEVDKKERKKIERYLNGLRDKKKYGSVKTISKIINRPVDQASAILYSLKEFREDIKRFGILQEGEEKLISLAEKQEEVSSLLKTLGYKGMKDFIEG